MKRCMVIWLMVVTLGLLGNTANAAILSLRNAADETGTLVLAPGQSGQIEIMLLIHGYDTGWASLSMYRDDNNNDLAGPMSITALEPGLSEPFIYDRSSFQLPADISHDLSNEYHLLVARDDGQDSPPGVTYLVDTITVTNTQGLPAGSFAITFEDYPDRIPLLFTASGVQYPWNLGFDFIPNFLDPGIGAKDNPFLVFFAEPCAGDPNGDWVVDPLDVGFVMARFACSVGTGDSECDAADQNDDGHVDPLDIGFVLARWGPCEDPVPAGPYTQLPTTRVSVASDGTEGDNGSDSPDVSADGRYVVFASYASNLVEGDTNDLRDIFIHDTVIGATERINTGVGGEQADQLSASPAISDDGCVVVFESRASNLVEGDDNAAYDIFIYDCATGDLELASIGLRGAAGNDESKGAGISGDGRYVVFESDADNLVEEDTNGVQDIFRYDRDTKSVIRVSTDSSGNEGDAHSYGPATSQDGNWVAFSSAGNLADSGDNLGDIFVRDVAVGTTEVVSVHSDGTLSNGWSSDARITNDGRFVTFRSYASNLVNDDTNGVFDVFLHDRWTHETERISLNSAGMEADDHCYNESVSDDGRYVVFRSAADNLAENVAIVSSTPFVRDRQTLTTTPISIDSAGFPAASSDTGISPDGRIAVFTSTREFVAGDTNNNGDVFVVDLAELE